MSAQRENAPLVEVIAELRWEPAPEAGMQVAGGPVGPTFIAMHSSESDAFFSRFASIARSLAHAEQERVVPPGYLALPYQPVYRFKHSEEGSVRTLYQIGPGLFSANAVPPYESWEERFEQVIRSGVEGLLQSRSKSEIARPFTGLSLRYIDAFTAIHTEGRDIGRFMEEVFKITVNAPMALTRHLKSDSTIKSMVQLQIPMHDGFVMGVSVGEGIANFQQAILMDTSVASALPVQANVSAVMERFARAHEAIGTTFRELVQPIDHLMPEKVEAKR